MFDCLGLEEMYREHEGRDEPYTYGNDHLLAEQKDFRHKIESLDK